MDKAAVGKLKITIYTNANLCKANKIKRAAQSGQTQSGEFILSLFSNESPVFGVDSIPLLATSHADLKRLDTASRGQLTKTPAAHGIKLLLPRHGQRKASIQSKR